MLRTFAVAEVLLPSSTSNYMQASLFFFCEDLNLLTDQAFQCSMLMISHDLFMLMLFSYFCYVSCPLDNHSHNPFTYFCKAGSVHWIAEAHSCIVPRFFFWLGSGFILTNFIASYSARFSLNFRYYVGNSSCLIYSDVDASNMLHLRTYLVFPIIDPLRFAVLTQNFVLYHLHPIQSSHFMLLIAPFLSTKTCAHGIISPSSLWCACNSWPGN